MKKINTYTIKLWKNTFLVFHFSRNKYGEYLYAVLFQVNATEANNEEQVYEQLSNFPYVMLCLTLQMERKHLRAYHIQGNVHFYLAGTKLQFLILDLLFIPQDYPVAPNSKYSDVGEQS